MQNTKIQLYIHTHPFNGPFSGTTQASRYQKGKNQFWILLKQETVSGSGISWATGKIQLHYHIINNTTGSATGWTFSEQHNLLQWP